MGSQQYNSWNRERGALTASSPVSHPRTRLYHIWRRTSRTIDTVNSSFSLVILSIFQSLLQSENEHQIFERQFGNRDRLSHSVHLKHISGRLNDWCALELDECNYCTYVTFMKRCDDFHGSCRRTR